MVRHEECSLSSREQKGLRNREHVHSLPDQIELDADLLIQSV
jgi:hypothetical protein